MRGGGGGGGVFKVDVESESPNEGACVRYMMNRTRQMRRRAKIHDE